MMSSKILIDEYFG